MLSARLAPEAQGPTDFDVREEALDAPRGELARLDAVVFTDLGLGEKPVLAAQLRRARFHAGGIGVIFLDPIPHVGRQEHRCISIDRLKSGCHPTSLPY